MTLIKDMVNFNDNFSNIDEDIKDKFLSLISVPPDQENELVLLDESQVSKNNKIEFYPLEDFKGQQASNNVPIDDNFVFLFTKQPEVYFRSLVIPGDAFVITSKVDNLKNQILSVYGPGKYADTGIGEVTVMGMFGNRGVFYQDANYQNPIVNISPEDEDVNFGKTIKSLSLPNYMKVYVYSETGYRGNKKIIFGGSNPNFSINMPIRSYRVKFHNFLINPIVYVYDELNFSGNFQTYAGATNYKNAQNVLVHDKASSLIVPKGVSVTLYEHPDQQGISHVFSEGSYPDLGIYGFNDKLSEITIVRNNAELVSASYQELESKSVGNPISLEETIENKTSVTQSVGLTLSKDRISNIKTSWANTLTTGIEVSSTVKVDSGIGASLSTTVSESRQKSFMIGEENTLSEIKNFGKQLQVTAPPNKTITASLDLQEKVSSGKLLYTFKLSDTDLYFNATANVTYNDYAEGNSVISEVN